MGVRAPRARYGSCGRSVSASYKPRSGFRWPSRRLLECLEAAAHAGTLGDRADPALHVRIVLHVEAEAVAVPDPGPGGDVRDRVLGAGQVRIVPKPFVDDAEQPAHFI